MPKSTKTKKHQFFTLIELITVLAIYLYLNNYLNSYHKTYRNIEKSKRQ